MTCKSIVVKDWEKDLPQDVAIKNLSAALNDMRDGVLMHFCLLEVEVELLEVPKNLECENSP